MENNEDKTTDIIQTDDDLNTEPQAEDAPPPKPQKRLPWLIPALAAAGLIVIVFAFIMEARANRLAAIPEPGTHAQRSAIQAEIDTFDWIEQMPLTINPYSRPGLLLSSVNGIVIHYIGNPGTTALQNRNYFEGLATSQENHVSSNFIIGLDGEIIQCIPVDEMAYASNRRNEDTLSIEICHPDTTGKFTDESYEAAVRLAAWLCGSFGLTEQDVIRHYDVQGKACPLYFVENEGAWAAFRADISKELAADPGT